MTDVIVAGCANAAGLNRKKAKAKMETKKANCKALLFVGYIIFMHPAILISTSAVDIKV